MARHHRQHHAPAAARAPGRTRRAVAIARLRARLAREGFPRLQMMLIVALTAGAGALASWALRDPLPSMALRYPVAVVIAYGVFFGLLWLWLRSGHEDWSSFDVDLGGGSGRGSGGSADACAFDGLAEGTSGDREGWFDGLGGDGDAWPLLLVLLFLAALASLLAIVIGLVWSAPVLFAEILFDGVLATGLYRRLRREDVSHWTMAALRRTAWPFGGAALLAAGIGAALQWFDPAATTLGQVFGR